MVLVEPVLFCVLVLVELVLFCVLVLVEPVLFWVLVLVEPVLFCVLVLVEPVLFCVLVLVEPVLFCVCWCCGLEKGGWSSMVAHVVAWSHINVITRETIKRACIFNYLISIYREKKKEKDREDLWKKLESLEVKSGNKNKLVNNVSS